MSLQSIRRHEARRVLEKQEGGNFYLSVDKDVLSRHFSLTNWNQGELSLETLERLASLITERGRVIGTDICGEPDPETVLLGRDGIDLNDTANRELLHFFLRLQGSGHSPRRRASGGGRRTDRRIVRRLLPDMSPREPSAVSAPSTRPFSARSCAAGTARDRRLLPPSRCVRSRPIVN